MKLNRRDFKKFPLSDAEVKRLSRDGQRDAKKRLAELKKLESQPKFTGPQTRY